MTTSAACPATIASGLRSRPRDGWKASALALLLTVSAVALHGPAFAAGGQGGGQAGSGAAGGTGYEGADGADAVDPNWLHAGGGGGGAGGGKGGAGAPGSGSTPDGMGGAGGDGGLNNQNGGASGDGENGVNGDGTQQGGEPGGSGGGGGAGGAGIYSSIDLDLLEDMPEVTFVLGGKGGNGGLGFAKGGAGGFGGDGGGAIVMVGQHDLIINNVETVTGGAGGNGGAGALMGPPAVAGGGGNGGAGVVAGSYGYVEIDGAAITGGKGGTGGTGRFANSLAVGGRGGDGGAGLDVMAMVVLKDGSVTGGNGGDGGTTAGAQAGNGGDGGSGIDATEATIIVGSGTSVTGGKGGKGGATSTAGSAGAGGVGIAATKTVVEVAGTVSGGLDGDGNNRAAAVAFTGGGNTLVLDSGYAFNGDITSDGANGGDTLALGGSDNGTFSLTDLDGTFGDFTSFAKSGTSTWTLTGSSSFAGTTTISEGTLHFAGPGMEDSDVSVEEDGTLSAASATVNSLDVAGTVEVTGSTYSYVYVNNGAKFEAGSTLSVAVDADGYGSLVYGHGNMEIEGGTVVVSAAAGVYDPTRSYNVLSGDTVTGTFDSAEMASPSFLAPTLHYTEYSAYLTFASDFSGAAGTSNQASVAKALDDWGTGALVDELLATDPADAGALFDNLSGESLGAGDQSQQQTASLVTGAVTDRVDEVLSALEGAEASGYAPMTESGPDDPSRSIWISGYGARASIEASSENAASNTDTAGLTFGLDGEIGDWTVGVMGGYGQSANTVADLGTTIDSSDYSAGVYAGGKWDDVRAVLGAVYTWSAFDSTRNVIVPDAETLTASYGGSTGSIFGEASKEFDLGVVSLTPYAGAQYLHVSGDAYDETGGNAALAVDARSADVFYTTLGLRSTADFVVGGDMLLSLGAGAGWRHAFTDDAVATHSFVAGGDSFAVSTAEVPADRLAVEASAGLDVSANLAIDLSYTGEFTGSTATNQVQAGIKGAF